MAYQEVCKQGRDDIIQVNVSNLHLNDIIPTLFWNYAKPHPWIFFTLEYNCSVKGAIEYFPTRTSFKLKSVTRFHDYLY